MDKPPSIGSQLFIVDTSESKQYNGQVPPLFKLLTPDGKEMLEVYEGAHTEKYNWNNTKWEWVSGGKGVATGKNLKGNDVKVIWYRAI